MVLNNEAPKLNTYAVDDQYSVRMKVPLDGLDVCLLVKDYLDRTGIDIYKFSQNCTGFY